MFTLSACVSGNDNEVLQSVVDSDASTTNSTKNTISKNRVVAETKPVQVDSQTQISGFAADDPPSLSIVDAEPILPPPAPPRVKKTYLINGLASNIDTIGYGFTNLSEKIPNSKLHNYASFIESSTVIRARVTKEIKDAYAADPNIEINLIGISFGANIVTWIAQELDRKKIPINYLATLEGPAMAPIRKNVRLADNFSCTRPSCFRTTSRLAFGNKKTEFSKFKIKAGHIALADHVDVHRRVLNQINKPLEPASDVQQFIVQQ